MHLHLFIHQVTFHGSDITLQYDTHVNEQTHTITLHSSLCCINNWNASLKNCYLIGHQIHGIFFAVIFTVSTIFWCIDVIIQYHLYECVEVAAFRHWHTVNVEVLSGKSKGSSSLQIPAQMYAHTHQQWYIHSSTHLTYTYSIRYIILILFGNHVSFLVIFLEFVHFSYFTGTKSRIDSCWWTPWSVQILTHYLEVNTLDICFLNCLNQLYKATQETAFVKL